VETNFQRRFSIDVWCGMIDDMLIGPDILDDRVTEKNYLDFLQNELPQQLDDIPLATRILCTSLIGGSVVAVPLTGHQDLQT